MTSAEPLVHCNTREFSQALFFFFFFSLDGRPAAVGDFFALDFSPKRHRTGAACLPPRHSFPVPRTRQRRRPIPKKVGMGEFGVWIRLVGSARSVGPGGHQAGGAATNSARPIKEEETANGYPPLPHWRCFVPSAEMVVPFTRTRFSEWTPKVLRWTTRSRVTDVRG